MLLRLMNCNKPVIQDAERVRPDTSEVYTLISDSTKAESKLGWRPEISLEEGLMESIRFLEKNLNNYKSFHYVL